MFNEIAEDLHERFEKATAALKRDFARIRTGRANASLLDGIVVEYYGVATPIGQVATIKVPEPRLITVSPWEKSLLGEIERAIHKADIGVTPSNDGIVIRLPIPPLTGERRQEFVKQARKLAEDARVAVRNARRDANDMLKDLEKSGEITEDDLRRHLTKVQELTDKAIAQVDGVLAEKEQEILEV